MTKLLFLEMLAISATFPFAFPVKIYSPFLSNAATMFCSHCKASKSNIGQSLQKYLEIIKQQIDLENLLFLDNRGKLKVLQVFKYGQIELI